MRTDFHLVGIYGLCAELGLNDACKRSIAFASEHVDHAVRDEAEGGITTAHGPIDSRNAVFEEGTQLWSAFHFLPGMLGTSFSERMVCRPSTRYVTTIPPDVSNSGPTGADLLIDWFLQQPFDPYLAGIIAHVLADTWSHRQFNGLFSYANDIDIIDARSKHIIDERKTWIRDVVAGTKQILLHFLYIGHGEAETIPDIPTEEWTFKDCKGGQWTRKNLTDSCLPAIEQLSGLFSAIIGANPVLREKPAQNGIAETILVGLRAAGPGMPIGEAESYPFYKNAITPDGLGRFHAAARKYLEFYNMAILDPIMKLGYGAFHV